MSDRHKLALAHIGGTAHDLRPRPVADVDRAHAQAVGAGVATRLEHPADHEPIERRHAVSLDALDLGPGHRQPLRDLRYRQVGSAVPIEPFQRRAHQSNCSSIRTSLSYRSRRSGTPCLSIAIRSIPMPNANPWIFSGS